MAETSRVTLDLTVLDRLPAALSSAIDSFLTYQAGALELAAWVLTPYRRGILRGTLGQKENPPAGTRVVQVGGPEAPYAWEVYFGTAKMAPRPFLAWAVAQIQAFFYAQAAQIWPIAVARAGGR